MTRSTGRLTSAAAVLLILVAGAAVFAGAPTALTAPASLLTLTVVAAQLAASRARGPVDAVLLACGGLLVTMVLTGLLLGITRIGLHPRSWALALGLVALVALVAEELFEGNASGGAEGISGAGAAATEGSGPGGVDGSDARSPLSSGSFGSSAGFPSPAGLRTSAGFSSFGSPGEFGGSGNSASTTSSDGNDTARVRKLDSPDENERWTPRLRNLPWAVAVVAIACVALTISVRATNNAEVSPLQMAVGSVRSGSAQIVVSSDEDSGRLELRTEAPDGTSLSYPLFSVAPGKPVSTSVVLPSKGRFVITLNNPDQSKPLRSLILDR